jgi:hypothetical protein
VTLSPRLFAFETRTGRVITDLPYEGVPRWECGVNAIGKLEVSIPIDPIGKKELRALIDPWRISLGFARGQQIMQAGPIIPASFLDSPGAAVLDVSCAGLWRLLYSRYLLNAAWDGVNPAAESADVNIGPTSLHTIAKRVVSLQLSRAQHDLPIDFPADIAGSHSRAYPGYDLASEGERLAELTQVQGGPEIEFRPVWTDTVARSTVRWTMRLGAPSSDPLRDGRLGRLDYPHAWDYGQALIQLDEDIDGSRQTHHRIERGNGMERALVVGIAADTQYPAAGWPYLEDVGGTHTSATDTATLASWAAGAVSTFRVPTVTWSAVVRMDGTDAQGRPTGAPDLGEVEVGNNAMLGVRGHRWIADGNYPARIIGIKSEGADTARLVLAPLQGAA